MLYRSTHTRDLVIVIGQLKYEVPPGGVCDIPPNLTYVVGSRGLPLVPADDGQGKRVEPSLVPPPAARRLPKGVEAGVKPDPDMAPQIEDEEEDAAPAVEAAVERLRSEGALPRRGKGK